MMNILTPGGRIDRPRLEANIRGVALLLLFTALAGCGGTAGNLRQDTAQAHGISMSHWQPQGLLAESVTGALYQQHEEWRDTPYRLGGMSRSGVDCSAFVLQTFRSKFGIQLPRTTAHQHQLGSKVKRSQLQPGDLVFFRTAEKQRHVGIYVEDQTFLHASSSQGVTLSSLDNRYWSSKFWKAKRLPQLQAGL